MLSREDNSDNLPKTSAALLKASPILPHASEVDLRHSDDLGKWHKKLETFSSSSSDDIRLDAVLNLAVELMPFLTKSDFVSSIIRESNSSDWVIKSKYGELDSLSERNCQQIMLSLLTSLFERDDMYLPCLSKLTLRNKTHYLMCIPLVKRKQILGGILVVRAYDGAEYAESELAAASLLGHWCNMKLDAIHGNEDGDTHHHDDPKIMAHLAECREKERQRIAADLHDGVAQWMLGVAYDIDICRAMAAIGNIPELKKSLSSAKKTIQKCTQEVRRAIADLKPVEMAKYGLVGAINSKAEEFNRYGINCVVALGSQLPPLTDSEERTIYWIVEEALNNARKHAQADSITVDIASESDSLNVTIMDNGKGFSNNSVGQPSPPLFTNGLKGMLTRARLIGADLVVNSSPGIGTVIKLSLRLKK
ncbi:sensor histidine kinase [Dehalogenimonas sp. WBC-2]|nr:sensor histidine kinase [Dehalogenimonas sp. WBC-2]